MSEESEKSTALKMYKHLTSQMTPEEALYELIRRSTEVYESLKLGKPPELEEGEVFSPLMVMWAAAEDMGWEMAFKADDPDKDVSGLILGTSEYVESVLKTQD